MNADSQLAPPLVVDLDGTLIRADLLIEGLFRILRTRPWRLLTLIPALLAGRAAFKAAVAAEADLDPARLPWRDDVLAFVRARHAQGQPIWLATAADQRPAQAVARHLGLFDRVLASAPERNLKGRHKLRAIQEAAPDGFDYVGDSRADRPLLARARQGWTTGPSAHALAREARARGACVEPLPGEVAATPLLLAVLRLIRPHQWLKNGLVFLPLIAAHQWSDPLPVTHTVLAALAFCLAASAAYVLNDLLDVEHDRNHPRKCKRPIASGAVAQPFALMLFPLLLLSALMLALFLPWSASAVLIGYFLLTTAYSVYLKRIALLDILTLAILYNLRIVGGGAAAGIVLSYWLVGFTLFLFFALAVMKRVTEVQDLAAAGQEITAGRGYVQGDERLLLPLGVGCSVAAAVVLGLYTTSDAVAELYARSVPLLLVVPVVLLWQCHLWLATIRGRMHDDPLVYAVRDVPTWCVGGLALVLFAASL